MVAFSWLAASGLTVLVLIFELRSVNLPESTMICPRNSPASLFASDLDCGTSFKNLRNSSITSLT